ncbi:MAG: TlpA family protein disulfide reductase [Gemmatimonadaceae bacterium]|jgi:thiol-disulfide isomerase/thioredoxin|nr:TlpA family protein disulfide reductase [Gemmatimonadaceae bacterium]
MSTLRTVSMLAIGAVSLMLARALPAQDPMGLAVGAKAPGAIVQTLDGKRVDLSSFLGKGPVVLEFWALWCGNCKELEPQIKSLVTKYAGKVTFVAVAVSVNESPDRVHRYATKYGYTHQVLFDADGAATDAYAVPATSYIVVVDRGGTIVYTGLGGEQDLEAAVRKGL